MDVKGVVAAERHDYVAWGNVETPDLRAVKIHMQNCPLGCVLDRFSIRQRQR